MDDIAEPTWTAPLDDDEGYIVTPAEPSFEATEQPLKS